MRRSQRRLAARPATRWAPASRRQPAAPATGRYCYAPTWGMPRRRARLSRPTQGLRVPVAAGKPAVPGPCGQRSPGRAGAAARVQSLSRRAAPATRSHDGAVDGGARHAEQLLEPSDRVVATSVQFDQVASSCGLSFGCFPRRRPLARTTAIRSCVRARAPSASNLVIIIRMLTSSRPTGSGRARTHDRGIMPCGSALT